MEFPLLRTLHRQREAESLVMSLGGRVSYREWRRSWISNILLGLGFRAIDGIRLQYCTLVDDGSLLQLPVLRSVEVLSLRSTHITGQALDCLRALPGLRMLDLGSTQVDDVGLSHVAKCRTISELFLDKTLVTSAGLASVARLPRLQCLSLDDTAIDDDCLEHVVKMSRLRWLRIKGTKVTAEGLGQVRESLPRCNVFAPFLSYGRRKG